MSSIRITTVIPRDLRIGDRVRLDYGPATAKEGWFRIVKIEKIRELRSTRYRVCISLDDVQVPPGQEPECDENGRVRLDPAWEADYYYASPGERQRILRIGA
jgi:hypothetical protein